jgi:capsular exopolysaccharide synthesis family protein
VVLFAAEHGHTGSPSIGVEANGVGTNGAGTNGHSTLPSASAPSSAKVLLLTSPSAGEGKTTSAAHLAAVLAEFGKTVLVISADFRRPRVHELFGVAREPGLSDVLASAGGHVKLSDLQMTTTFAGVHLLPSGSPVNNPAQLLTETAQLVAAARSLFDFVIIDTPPLLVANDASELASAADMVILFAKADRTTRDSARRSTEILQRIDAPVLGVVIVSAHDTPTAYGYYRYRYYADADQGASGRRTSRRRKASSATDSTPAAVVAEQSNRP